MGILIKQFVLLLSVQIIIAERSWIVEDISGRRYLVSYINGSPNTRKYPYNIRPLNVKEIYYKTGRAKKASVDKKAIGLRKNQVKDKPDFSAVCNAIDLFSLNSGIPCGIDRSVTPMFVYFSFDDAVTSSNIGFYRQLFSAGDRRNPNGCPIKATFFNSDSNTQYDLVNELHRQKHELASHSVSHRGPPTWWSKKATKEDWVHEIVGQRKNIHRQTAALDGSGVPTAEIRGMRAPFLSVGGDDQFQMLEDYDFVYDSSITNNDRKPLWPFTMHDPSAVREAICRGKRCPIRAHRVWEVVMNVYYLNESGSITPCSMIDGCRPRDERRGALHFLRENFKRHYGDVDKVPFGINMHAAWFAFDGYLNAMNDFIDELLGYDDVYIVPIYKLVQWMKAPKTLSQLKHSKFGC